MTIAGHFSTADILDTLSWVGLTFEARVARLANLYLDEEPDIVDAHRNYQGPTIGIIRAFVKSHYSPPRGQGNITYEAIKEEIPKQLKVQKKRLEFKPWTFKKKKKIGARLNHASKRLYTIWANRWGKDEKQPNNCIAMTRMAGCVMVADGGSYRTRARVYLRSVETGEIKVVVLQSSENTVRSLSDALLRMVPVHHRRGLFDGSSAQFDFEKGAFLINGKVVPWEVVKVYSGDLAHKTRDHDV